MSGQDNINECADVSAGLNKRWPDCDPCGRPRSHCAEQNK